MKEPQLPELPDARFPPHGPEGKQHRVIAQRIVAFTVQCRQQPHAQHRYPTYGAVGPKIPAQEQRQQPRYPHPDSPHAHQQLVFPETSGLDVHQLAIVQERHVVKKWDAVPELPHHVGQPQQKRQRRRAPEVSA